jgi:cytochrome b561
MKNSKDHYGSVARWLHWGMAILFVMMFGVAYIMINIPKSDFRLSLYNLHKATGLLLFDLFMIRIVWRFLNIQPEEPQGLPLWQRLSAKSNVWLLYLLMIVMPVSGFLTSTLGGHDVMFYGIFTIPPFGHDPGLSAFYASAHEILSYVLIAVFALHVLGAGYHHFRLKDDVLVRML